MAYDLSLRVWRGDKSGGEYGDRAPATFGVECEQASANDKGRTDHGRRPRNLGEEQETPQRRPQDASVFEGGDAVGRRQPVGL